VLVGVRVQLRRLFDVVLVQLDAPGLVADALNWTWWVGQDAVREVRPAARLWSERG
jgi:hypothetical protein